MDCVVLETDRLILREMRQADFEALAAILGDAETMYAYEGAFSELEIHSWLDRQIEHCRAYGFSLWAVILRESG